MGDAVLAPVDDKAMEMLVAPAQGELKGGVEVGNGTVAGDQEAAPDQRADAPQDDAELVGQGGGGREGFGHPAILTQAPPNTWSPTVCPGLLGRPAPSAPPPPRFYMLSCTDTMTRNRATYGP